MKKLLIVAPLLLVGCGAFQSTPTTTTSTTTTTIDYGSDCNATAIAKWYKSTKDLLTQSSKIQSGTKLLNISNHDKYISYMSDIRMSLYRLDLPFININSLIQSIDDLIEDTNYYFAYNGNSYSVAQINNSRNLFYKELELFYLNYYEECYEK